MRFENIENHFFVTVHESTINEKMGTVKYTREDTGETYSIAREWFTKWFQEASSEPTKDNEMKNKTEVTGFFPFQVRVSGEFRDRKSKTLSRHKTKEECVNEVKRLESLGVKAYVAWYLN